MTCAAEVRRTKPVDVAFCVASVAAFVGAARITFVVDVGAASSALATTSPQRVGAYVEVSRRTEEQK